jgi:hypothetical protein
LQVSKMPLHRSSVLLMPPTSELSSHKTLLDALHSLREADRDTLQQMVYEVDLLKLDKSQSLNARQDAEGYKIEDIQWVPCLQTRPAWHYGHSCFCMLWLHTMNRWIRQWSRSTTVVFITLHRNYT